MKLKIFSLIALALLMFLPAAAQSNAKKSREDMRREFKEFKIKFIAQEIDVTAEQMKDFTELYSQMEDERGKIFGTAHKMGKSIKAKKNASDTEYQKLNNLINEAKEKDAQISKEFDSKFSKILTSRQIVKMKDAEECFRRKMHEMRHNKKMKRKGK